MSRAARAAAPQSAHAVTDVSLATEPLEKRAVLD
jgi:hypothetical protein